MGPRNCIGKKYALRVYAVNIVLTDLSSSLAYAEMRLILARVLWNFDLELAPQSMNWSEGLKIFILWDKPSLFVKLKPVKRP